MKLQPTQVQVTKFFFLTSFQFFLPLELFFRLCFCDLMNANKMRTNRRDQCGTQVRSQVCWQRHIYLNHLQNRTSCTIHTSRRGGWKKKSLQFFFFSEQQFTHFQVWSLALWLESFDKIRWNPLIWKLFLASSHEWKVTIVFPFLWCKKERLCNLLRVIMSCHNVKYFCCCFKFHAPCYGTFSQGTFCVLLEQITRNQAISNHLSHTADHSWHRTHKVTPCVSLHKSPSSQAFDWGLLTRRWEIWPFFIQSSRIISTGKEWLATMSISKKKKKKKTQSPLSLNTPNDCQCKVSCERVLRLCSTGMHFMGRNSRIAEKVTRWHFALFTGWLLRRWMRTNITTEQSKYTSLKPREQFDVSKFDHESCLFDVAWNRSGASFTKNSASLAVDFRIHQFQWSLRSFCFVKHRCTTWCVAKIPRLRRIATPCSRIDESKFWCGFFVNPKSECHEEGGRGLEKKTGVFPVPLGIRYLCCRRRSSFTTPPKRSRYGLHGQSFPISMTMHIPSQQHSTNSPLFWDWCH